MSPCGGVINAKHVRFKRIVEGPNPISEIMGATLMCVMAGLALYQGIIVKDRLSIFLDGGLFGVCALMCRCCVYQAVREFKIRKVYYVRV